MITQPRSLTVTRTVSMAADVSTTFFGMFTICTGILISRSYVSLSVMNIQNDADSSRKKTNTRNCLFLLLNKKFLIVLKNPSSSTLFPDL